MIIKKWIPVIVLTVVAFLSTTCAAVSAFLAYLAVTGLDLLVTAKYELPRDTIILLIISGILWVADILCFIIMKLRTYSRKDS